MDLCTVTVTGFRRFRDRTTLKTNGKLVALVGPNEAGKSSFLEAVRHLSHNEPVLDRDISRGLPSSAFHIEGRFFLSLEDANSAGLSDQKWLIITKKPDGRRTARIEPSPPKRDLELRGRLLSTLHSALELTRLKNDTEDGVADLLERWDKIRAILQSDDEDISAESIDETTALVLEIAKFARPRDPAAVRRLPDTVSQWADVERSPNPNKHAISALMSRLPNIIEFDDDDRDLRSEYSIETLSTSVPHALKNLFEVAKLNAEELIAAHGRGDTAHLTTMEHAANKALESSFGENWKQSGVLVTIRIQGSSISIQVVNEKSEFTSFAERSDGLRQFVALQSFATCNWSGAPILLIDEAEQKLHYDAQADLVQMLARQNVASKVIFTTHSAGCLPEDLGNGVRLARPSSQDETKSEIVNKFWAEQEPGFAPLLFGMGASTLAFFPTRNAVMVEGPSDMLLLPTMFRDALELSVLGFQTVPGLAESDKRAFAPIMSKKSSLLYLLDGDDAGQNTRSQLIQYGVSKDNVFILKSRDSTATELEDFINPDLVVLAVNQLLTKFHGAVKSITKNDLVAKHRTKELRKWFKQATKSDISKVDFAYEVLDIVSEIPKNPLLDPKRRAIFSSVARAMLNRLSELKA